MWALHPTVGWENEEAPSFLARARGRFDCVLMLGLIHHLAVSERIPLDSILDLGAGLTTDLLLIEYVTPEDPQFVKLARGREALYRDLTVGAFESLAARRFEIFASVPVGSTRRLYALRKRGA